MCGFCCLSRAPYLLSISIDRLSKSNELPAVRLCKLGGWENLYLSLSTHPTRTENKYIYIYICMYIHLYAHAGMHTYIHTYVHPYTRTYLHT